jgi:hypothetical protein
MKTKFECPQCRAWLPIDFGSFTTAIEHDGTDERAAEVQAHRWLHYGKTVYETLLAHYLYDCIGDGSTGRHLQAVNELT